jgi:hypothetical protein
MEALQEKQGLKKLLEDYSDYGLFWQHRRA